jgi:two-component system, OmpR family, response regulator
MSLVARFDATLVRNRAGVVKPRSGDRHNVLVIEDDPDLLKLVGEIMRTAGFSMCFARNRAEVKAELTRQPLPDLVLLDLKLPDLDGFELLEDMRSDSRLEDLPVILTTGLSQAHHVARGLSLGADGYITKPYRMSQLVTAVNTVLGRA